MNGLRAEAWKLVSLPSVGWALGLTLVSTALLSAVAPGALGYTQAGFLVLGVLASSSEYGDGDSVRTTLLALPRRFPLLGSKFVALVVVSSVTAVAVALSAGDLGNVMGAAVVLTLVAVVGAGAGLLARRAEPALVVLLVAWYVADPLLRRVCDVTVVPARAVLDPGAGALVAVAWAVSLGAVAAVVFRFRDA